jgi:hypothetical protein
MLRRHAREMLRAAELRPTDAEAVRWRADASVLDAEAARMEKQRREAPIQTDRET